MIKLLFILLCSTASYAQDPGDPPGDGGVGNAQGVEADRFDRSIQEETGVFEADADKKEDLFTIYDKEFRDKTDKGQIKFGSNFDSCEINLWEDYLLFLAKHCVRKGASTDSTIGVTESAQCEEGTEGSMLGYELMLTGAEYVTGGGPNWEKETDGVADMWRDPTGEHKNILQSLRKTFGERAQKRDILKAVLTAPIGEIGTHVEALKAHLAGASDQGEQDDGGLAEFVKNALGRDLASMEAKNVESFASTVEEWGGKRKQMQCLCLSKAGLGSMDEAQKADYQSLCPDFAAEDTDMSAVGDKVLLGSDASGLKYKRLLVLWAYINRSLHDTLFKGDEQAFNDLKNFTDWYKATEWDHVEERWLGRKPGTMKAQFYLSAPTQANAARLPPVYKYTQYKKTSWLLTLLAVAAAVAVTVFTAGAGLSVLVVLSNIVTGSALYLAINHDLASKRAFNNAVNRIAAPAMTGIFDLEGGSTDLIPTHHDIEVNEYSEGNPILGRTHFKEFHRYIKVPFNKKELSTSRPMHRCGAPSSAAACVVEWLNVEIHGDTRVLIDPWVPVGITEDEIIQDKNNNYSNMAATSRVWAASDNVIEQFNRTLHPLKGQAGWKQQCGKRNSINCVEIKDSEGCTKMVNQLDQDGNPVIDSQTGQPVQVCEEAKVKGVDTPAVDPTSLVWWIPMLHPYSKSPFRPNVDAREIVKKNALQATQQSLIKEKAREYILSTGIIREDLEDYLQVYEEYVYEFHYIYPRFTKKEAIKYPPHGMLMWLGSLLSALEYLAEHHCAEGSGGCSVDAGGSGGGGSGSGGGGGALDEQGDSGRWNTLLSKYAGDLIENAKAFRANRSVGMTREDDQEQVRHQGFSPVELASLGFGEWNFALPESRATIGSRQIGNPSIQGGATAGATINSRRPQEGLNFQGALNRFRANRAERRQEQEHWDNTVGQSPRGEGLALAANRFHGAFRSPSSRSSLKNISSSNLNDNPFKTRSSSSQSLYATQSPLPGVGNAYSESGASAYGTSRQLVGGTTTATGIYGGASGGYGGASGGYGGASGGYTNSMGGFSGSNPYGNFGANQTQSGQESQGRGAYGTTAAASSGKKRSGYRRGVSQLKNLSLFEIVSKAYMRNYGRVLIQL